MNPLAAFLAVVVLAAPATQPAVPPVPVPSSPEAFIALQVNREKMAKQVADLTAKLAAIDAALAKADGRAKSPVPGTPLMNGFEVKEADCESSVLPVELKPTFNPKKSWFFSAEFQSSAALSGLLLFWGDSRGGSDPMQVRLRGGKIEVGLTDCPGRKKQDFSAAIPAHAPDSWVKVEFVFDARAGKGHLRVNGGPVASASLTAAPVCDVPMGINLGGIDARRDRFAGKLRNVLLTNYDPPR